MMEQKLQEIYLIIMFLDGALLLARPVVYGALLKQYLVRMLLLQSFLCGYFASSNPLNRTELQPLFLFMHSWLQFKNGRDIQGVENPIGKACHLVRLSTRISKMYIAISAIYCFVIDLWAGTRKRGQKVEMYILMGLFII